MYILAIETSCDETSVSILKGPYEILSNIIASQIEEHQLYGGVVPEIASRRHVESISAVCAAALREANLTLQEIDLICATYAPGLIGSLLVGFNFAKGLAFSSNKPFVPVHHIKGHIAANYISHPDLRPPFLSLVVSGGHTHLIEVLTPTTFKIWGKTVDDAGGEALDKVARALGLPYPGGVSIEKVGKSGNPFAFSLPTPKVAQPYDFSFSGLKTAALNIINQQNQKGEPLPIADLSASFQEKVVTILCEKTITLALDLNYTTITLAGGVSANQRLREKMLDDCKKHGISLLLPHLSLTGDNAAMIAAQGYFEYQEKNNFSYLGMNAVSNLSIDSL